MKQYETEVLVIGGGATGTGILRDLAMRGFKCLLVEKRDLAHGTTGRYHGLLHSGGRYVVKDPQAAVECIKENYILRKIMPFCIEDTGGFFVTTPWDNPEYAESFVAGCRNAGIPIDEISIPQMLKEEPLLNPSITRCFRVPDASADSFIAAEANVISARQYGAQSLTYHEVKKLSLSKNKVIGAVCYDLVKDEDVQINADFVINASGAWAGKVAASIGLEIQIKPGKGTMVAINHRILNTVVNRCKMPADGDIIVPAHTVAVIGTTDEQVQDADRFSIEPWEIERMLDEGEKLIPGLRNMRMLRAWAGVRPLYQESKAADSTLSRDLTRAYVLLDHEQRDDITGMITITSGKWTTYRMMAEAAVDLAANKLGVQRNCRTQNEILPSPDDSTHSRYHWLGTRLAKIESQKSYGQLICECELVTEEEVIHSITKLDAKGIDDIRRDTRLGMGPCQGGFCTFRAAGILHRLKKLPVEDTNAALKDFLQERWKGLYPVLWGQQLRQERLDELIYLNILNIPNLPGPQQTRLASENYQPPSQNKTSQQAPISNEKANLVNATSKSQSLDALVIGAGLAGLAATWQLAEGGQRVHCISKGWGSHYWGSGCIDVLACSETDSSSGELELRPAIDILIQENPSHPYALAGIDQLERSLFEFQNLCNSAGYPLLPPNQEDLLAQNWLLPTTLGTLRQTALAPQTMINGDCREKIINKRYVLVGFAGFPDFYPEMAAENLRNQGIMASAVQVNLPVLQESRFLTSRTLAQHFEKQEFQKQVAQSIKTQLARLEQSDQDFIGFPAVLGTKPNLEIWQNMQALLDLPVFEMPGLPPSIPGMRLHQILINAISSHTGRVFDGMKVEHAAVNGSRIISVASEAAARPKHHTARNFILATGGILGGGIMLPPPETGKRSLPREVVLNAPIFHSETDNTKDMPLFRREFLHPQSHPIFKMGFKVGSDFRILDHNGHVYLENLFGIGGALFGVDPIREHSLEGIALLSAFIASESIQEMNSSTQV